MRLYPAINNPKKINKIRDSLKDLDEPKNLTTKEFTYVQDEAGEGDDELLFLFQKQFLINNDT